MNSNGSIVVPTGGTQILLEHNIVVSFSLDPSVGEFRSGDYWVSAARHVDASVEELEAKPPLGIHHHYAKLAIVNFPDDETDCREFWPPTLQGEPPPAVDQCACTRCVTPVSHSDGTLTVQMAIDQVMQHGGGTVCLDVGTYALQQTLQVQNAGSLHIVGKGSATRVQATTRVLRIEDSQDVTLEGLAIICRPGLAATAPDAAVVLTTSKDVRLKQVSISVEGNPPSWAALDLTGALAGVTVVDSQCSAVTGIRSADPTGGSTGLIDLRIENNSFECQATALRLTGVTVHQVVSHIRGNRVVECEEAGMILTGATVPGHGVDVSENVLTIKGHGIVSALDGLRIRDNTIVQAVETTAPRDGIQLMPGIAANDSLDNIAIQGNRIAGFHGVAVHMRAPRSRGLMIKQNRIERVRQGTVFEAVLQFEQATIENNQLALIEGPGIRGEGNLATLVTTGNQIDSRSSESAVLLAFNQGEQVFSHNQCDRQGATTIADVVLRGGTLIVASNRIQTSGLSMNLTVPEQHYTVLGNICRGRIIVNNAALPQPWTPLNMQNVA